MISKVLPGVVPLKNKPIYVEVPIYTNLEKLWEYTQKPHLHEKWDLRFSSITYLPKEENEPQHFVYKTKIGFGVQIEGWGKSVGQHHADDESRTSSLHFGTDQAISIIREGRGYWKYIPTKNSSILFLTEYNYETNFGHFGKWFDYFIFRPLIGWATALSFDVLKRWLEKGESPISQYRKFFNHWLLTFTFFFIWMYQGLVPKLWKTHQEEIKMISNGLSVSINQATGIVIVVGIAEMLFSLFWLFYRNKYPLFKLQLLLFPVLTIAVMVTNPSTLNHPFNPIIVNGALFVLSIIGLLHSKDVPTATSCRRKR